MAILDDDLKPVPTGELGQFAISTSDPGLFLGYYKDRERTEAVVRNGWYLTGDLAYQDSEGYFFIAGRRDDCFKSRGIFISPTEIENALQKHPAIIEAAVVPIPDVDIGNKIHAIVVLAEGYTPSSEFAQSIRESLRSQIAPYKIPHDIEFTESLPKSAIGKILRAAVWSSRHDDKPFPDVDAFGAIPVSVKGLRMLPVRCAAFDFLWRGVFQDTFLS